MNGVLQESGNTTVAHNHVVDDASIDETRRAAALAAKEDASLPT
jgi:hypothetical protein